MKQTKKLLSVLLALAMLFVCGACSIEFGGEETWEYSSEDKDGTLELYHDFFAKTFEATNQEVSVTGSREGLIMTETIDGTSDHIVYSNTGAETYAFVDGSDYIYALNTGDATIYWADKEYYNNGYYAYKTSLNVLDMLPEDDSLSYACTVKGESKDGNSTATLTVEVKNESDYFKLEASSVNDLVENVTYSRSEDGADVTLTFAFTYGSASVTIPDRTDWLKQD